MVKHGSDAPGARQHTVAIAFVQGALHALPAAQAAELLRQSAIAPELLAQPQSRVPAAAFAALWMAVARHLDDEFFGLDRRRMKVGSFALLCHAAASQASLGQGLRLVLRGFGLMLDDLQAGLSVAGEQARIELSNRIVEADARRFADEALLVMLHGLLCWMAGRRVTLAGLDLAHPRPPHADEYRRMFTPQTQFDRPVTALCFDAALLGAPMRLGPGALKAFLRDAPQSVFLKQVSSAGWAERLRRRLRSSNEQWPTLQVLAGEFALSEATLRRRLEAEGTQWQQLKDDLRRDMAIHHLADPSQSVAAIALRLGFDDASTFHRAFRKWTGSAPGAYRVRAVASSGAQSPFMS